MSQIDIKVEEYKSLRSGIDMHLKHIPEILAFMVAATSALLGYGFSLGVPFVFLTPLPIILSCAYLIQTQMEEVLRKGAYIMMQYEQEDRMWESTLYKHRQEREKDKKWVFTKAAGDSRAIVIITDSLLILCFVGFICFLPSSGASICLKMIYAALGALTIPVVTYFLPPIRSILKAYTSEKEKEFLDDFKKFSE